MGSGSGTAVGTVRTTEIVDNELLLVEESPMLETHRLPSRLTLVEFRKQIAKMIEDVLDKGNERICNY